MPSLKEIIKKHSSLILIVFGAGCFFLSNIIFKQNLTESDFGKYSLLVTYLSLVYIYGLLGFEQVIMRYSNLFSKNIVITQKFSYFLVIITSVFTSLVFSVLFNTYFFDNTEDIVLLITTSICMILNMTYFSVFRLNEDYTIAQFIANYWKIFLLIFCVVFLFSTEIFFADIVKFVSILIIGFTVLFSILFYKKIKIKFENNISKSTIIKSFFYFFISITSFSLITFGDRFIIEKNINIETLGTYFYLSNFILAPFNIIQNYIGFKQINEYKKEIKSSLIFKNIIKAIVIGILLGSALVLFIILIDYFKILNFNFKEYYTEICLFLLLGLIKLYSSVISPAFEVSTNINMLRKFNISLIIISILFITILLSIKELNLEIIIINLMILWLTRTLIQHYLLKKNIY